MASGPKIVHKQFNSPIGLYSQKNIRETLDKHITTLDNGSVGINFGNPGTDKPVNLANSAVLRLLQEEEQNRNGKLDPSQIQAILETLVRMNHRFDQHWPPHSRTARHWDGQLNANSNIYTEFMKATKGYKKVVWPPTAESNGDYQPQQPQGHAQQYNQQQHSPQPQYSPQPRQNQAPKETIIPVQHYKSPQQTQPQYRAGEIPIPVQHYKTNQAPATYQDYQQVEEPRSQTCEGLRQEKSCGLSRLIPVGPGVQAAQPAYRAPPSPGSYRQPPPSSRWAPVASPLSPQSYGSQNTYPAQSLSPQPYSPQPYSQQSQYSPNQYSSQPEPYQPRPFEAPASTITLRQQAPIHQKPAPVYNSQPAAASYGGGPNMRGDNKWPPQAVREAVAAENQARRQLAQGPACRPRKVNKDYTSFFAQNALPHNYPGYKAPPGTQHYEENSGRTSY